LTFDELEENKELPTTEHRVETVKKLPRPTKQYSLGNLLSRDHDSTAQRARKALFAKVDLSDAYY